MVQQTISEIETRKKTKSKLELHGTLKTIYERRAVRKYKGKLVETKLIEQIIEAGRMAPSAINMQPWKFYVLTNKELIKSFSKEIGRAATVGMIKSGVKNIVKTAIGGFRLAHGLDFLKEEDAVFHGAPVVFFITSPTDNEWAALDIGMCSQNMMLAAKTLGLDTCPIGMAKYVEGTDIFPQLKIPRSEQVQLAIVLGYGDETPPVHERKKDNVFFIQ